MHPCEYDEQKTLNSPDKVVVNAAMFTFVILGPTWSRIRFLSLIGPHTTACCIITSPSQNNPFSSILQGWSCGRMRGFP